MTALASPLVARLARASAALGLVPGDRVLVGVSGGADSMALGALLTEVAREALPLRITFGYVDHGWRGPAEADADFAAVTALADRMGVRALRAGPPLASLPRTEDVARRHRYVALARMAREVDAGAVVVAHHLGDQAETLVMRVLRGSGAFGLAGIPPRRPLGDDGRVVLRPLLDVHPDVLHAWLRDQGIAWREDPTNRDLSRERARVRDRLAAHAARHGDARSSLAALAERLRRRIALQDTRIAHTIEGDMQVHPWAGAVRARRADLLALDTPLALELGVRVMGRAIHADREGPWLTRRVLRAMHRVLHESGALDLPRLLRFHVSGTGAWIAHRTRPELGIPMPRVDLVDLAVASFSRSSTDVYIDADVLGDAARYRLLDTRDRFIPFGSRSQRSVNATRWLSKQGVPGLARRGLLVLEGCGGVAWIVGVRLDARHAVVQDTRRVVRVRSPEPTEERGPG